MGSLRERTTFLTDNVRNMSAALRTLPFQNMHCTIHNLQLSVKKANAESGTEPTPLPKPQPQIAKCHKVVGHLKEVPANER